MPAILLHHDLVSLVWGTVLGGGGADKEGGVGIVSPRAMRAILLHHDLVSLVWGTVFAFWFSLKVGTNFDFPHCVAAGAGFPR